MLLLFQRSNFWCERVNDSELTPLRHVAKNEKGMDK